MKKKRYFFLETYPANNYMCLRKLKEMKVTYEEMLEACEASSTHPEHLSEQLRHYIRFLLLVLGPSPWCIVPRPCLVPGLRTLETMKLTMSSRRQNDPSVGPQKGK